MAEINRTKNNTEKSLAEVLREMKAELLAFATTRYELLSAELRDKFAVWKASLPGLIVAGTLALGAFITLTFAIVAVVAAFIGTAYAWAWAALMVCVLYGLAAALIGFSAYRRISGQSLAPERTIRVLKQDQQWIRNETRAA